MVTLNKYTLLTVGVGIVMLLAYYITKSAVTVYAGGFIMGILVRQSALDGDKQ